MSGKKSLYTRLREQIGMIAGVLAIVTALAGIFGYQFGATKTTEQYQQYQQIGTQKLNDLLAALPEEKKALYQPLINSMTEITRATASGDNSETILADIETATGQVGQFIKTAPVLGYNITKSPFMLPIGKTAILCDNQFSVGLPEKKSHNNIIRLIVYDKKERGYRIGSVIRVAEGDKKMTLTLLEMLPAQNAVAFSFRCS